MLFEQLQDSAETRERTEHLCATNRSLATHIFPEHVRASLCDGRVARPEQKEEHSCILQITACNTRGRRSRLRTTVYTARSCCPRRGVDCLANLGVRRSTGVGEKLIEPHELCFFLVRVEEHAT